MSEYSTSQVELIEGKILTEHEPLQNLSITKLIYTLTDLQLSGKPGFQQFLKDLFKLIGQDENFSELKAEIKDCKESKSTKMVMELSRMCGQWADQNEHLTKEVGKNTRKSETPIKTQQVTQTSKKFEFPTQVDFEINSNPSGGGFRISRSEGSESAISKSSDSKSESSVSQKKIPNSPVKNDAPKVKETKTHDQGVLLKKISTLEKQRLSLKKENEDLKHKRALLKAEKAKMAKLKLMISESNRKLDTLVEKFRIEIAHLVERNEITTDNGNAEEWN